ncbi:MAG TPA: Xaa-Pro peptidase family protein [Bacillales bacterium]|nr:Xaa-Pro peptidase family protein [Bacillales bacterium]
MEQLFGMTEYRQRLDQVKKRMEGQGVDVLLISNPSNINYLSGYDAYSFYVVQALIVIKEQDQPIWVGRREDANGAKLTTWLDDDHIYYYTDDYLHSETKHPMDVVADLFKKLNQDRRRIGVEMGSYYCSAIGYETFKSWLPDAEFINTTTLVSNVRMVKSTQELQYMRNAAANAEHAMETGIQSIYEGVSENQVAANIYHAQLSGAEGIDGDYPSIVPLLLSGVKTSSPHLTWDGSLFQGNEIVTLELAGVYKRYHSPLARTIKLGQPTSRERRLADAVYDSINETLDAVKPGITCGEVATVWSETIKKHGYEKYDRLGYSVGLSYPPNWSEHTASIRQGNQTVLQPNMTFHLIPGLWENDCGVEISETFVVTENGCETLANYPRDLIIKESEKTISSQG